MNEDRKYFAQIISTREYDGSKYIVQERVRDNGGVPTEEQIREFEKVVFDYDIEDVEFNKEYRRNCVLTDEGVKIYDIGCWEGAR